MQNKITIETQVINRVKKIRKYKFFKAAVTNQNYTHLEIAVAYIRRMINNVHLRMLCIIIIHRRKTNIVKHGRKKSQAPSHHLHYFFYGGAQYLWVLNV
jgi:hypothetical protein